MKIHTLCITCNGSGRVEKRFFAKYRKGYLLRKGKGRKLQSMDCVIQEDSIFQDG